MLPFVIIFFMMIRPGRPPVNGIIAPGKPHRQRAPAPPPLRSTPPPHRQVPPPCYITGLTCNFAPSRLRRHSYSITIVTFPVTARDQTERTWFFYYFGVLCYNYFVLDKVPETKKLFLLTRTIFANWKHLEAFESWLFSLFWTVLTLKRQISENSKDLLFSLSFCLFSVKIVQNSENSEIIQMLQNASE